MTDSVFLYNDNTDTPNLAARKTRSFRGSCA